MQKDFSNDFIEKFSFLKTSLIQSKDTIQITPFGAGSKKKFNNNIRKLAEVTRRSTTPIRIGRILFQLGEHIKAKKVLELGTNLGLGSAQLAQISSVKKVKTVEGCSELVKHAKRNIEKLNLNSKIEVIESSFLEYLSKTDEIFDLIYIDGDHQKSAIIEILKELEKNTHDESLIILDDIRWNKDMYSAWREISKSTKYNLSIDFFRLGVIAKRSKQEKEHFTLRK